MEAHAEDHAVLCWQCRMYPAAQEDGRCADCPVETAPPGGSAVSRSLAGASRFSTDSLSMRRFSSPAALGSVVIVLLTVVLLIHKSRMLLVAVEWNAGAGLDDAVEYGEGLQRPGQMLAMEIVALLEFTLHVATVVVFLLWFHRICVNAEVLGPDVQRRGPSMVVGGWFISIAGLWLPMQAMNDAWRASWVGAARVSTRVVAVWWALWLSMWAAVCVEAVIEGLVSTEHEFSASAGAGLVSEVFTVCAAVAAIVLVRRLTSMQMARYTEAYYRGSYHRAMMHRLHQLRGD